MSGTNKLVVVIVVACVCGGGASAERPDATIRFAEAISFVDEELHDSSSRPGDSHVFTQYSDDGTWLTEDDFSGWWHSDARRYAIQGNAALDYHSVPGDALWGTNYGFNSVLHLRDKLSFLGSAHGRHMSNGSQIAGSLGLILIDPSDPEDPWGISMVFDQFSDSRIDGLYMTQLRTQVGYSLHESLEIGAVYSLPMNIDRDVPYVSTFGGVNFPALGSAMQSESVFGYVAGERMDGIQWTLNFGFQEDPDSFVMAGSLLRPITAQTNAYAQAGYSAEVGTWTMSFGLQFRPGSTASGTSSAFAARAREASDFALAHFIPGVDGPGLREVPGFDSDALTATAATVENPADAVLAAKHMQQHGQNGKSQNPLTSMSLDPQNAALIPFLNSARVRLLTGQLLGPFH